MTHSISPLLKSEIPGLTVFYSFADSRFARLILASTNQGLCSVSLVMGDDAEALTRLKSKFKAARFEFSREKVQEEFLKCLENKPSELQYHLLGTPFQLEVWKALLNVPFGGSTTYGALAAEIGRPKACRAVGSAVGDNPIFFAIPCHRVLPASGGVGNYFWGPALKKAILDWETSI